MIITTEEELRRCLPSHAIDHIEAFTGYIDNSEHEFLLQPLGPPLYERLCDWYDKHRGEYSVADGKDVGYWNRLLLIAQRCVAFDAMGRAIDQQAVSINGAGVNFASAEDYKTADRDSISAAKQSFLKEARSSRYFYLAAQLLIPSATVLQEYLNIYDSREKFIQMLPDLHFIQEEQIAPAIGEDFCEHLVGLQVSGGTKRDATAATSSRPKSLADDAAIQPVLRRLLHKLRKIEATLLEGRTKVVKVDKDRRIAAHDEGIRLLGQFASEYCQEHQDDILLALGLPKDVLQAMNAGAIAPADLLTDYPEAFAYVVSPLFVAPVVKADAAPSQKSPSACSSEPRIDGMLVTPPLL